MVLIQPLHGDVEFGEFSLWKISQFFVCTDGSAAAVNGCELHWSEYSGGSVIHCICNAHPVAEGQSWTNCTNGKIQAIREFQVRVGFIRNFVKKCLVDLHKVDRSIVIHQEAEFVRPL